VNAASLACAPLQIVANEVIVYGTTALGMASGLVEKDVDPEPARRRFFPLRRHHDVVSPSVAINRKARTRATEAFGVPRGAATADDASLVGRSALVPQVCVILNNVEVAQLLLNRLRLSSVAFIETHEPPKYLRTGGMVKTRTQSEFSEHELRVNEVSPPTGVAGRHVAGR